MIDSVNKKARSHEVSRLINFYRLNLAFGINHFPIKAHELKLMSNKSSLEQKIFLDTTSKFTILLLCQLLLRL